MEQNLERNGTFSSSSMWKLTTSGKGGGFGAPALKYIKQVNYELTLGRPINKEMNSRPTSWGNFLEKRAFDLLPMEYELVSKDRLFHPEYKHWSGAPDLMSPNTVGDCKCPVSLEVFCDKLNALKNIATYKEEFPEDYWQHISNAILLEKNGFPVTHFEAIIYVPYKSELDSIREDVSNFDGNQNSIAWINWAQDSELPYLNDGGFYKNLNVVRFPVSPEDKEFLTVRVAMAEKHLTL